MRERQDGHIINITSIGGQAYPPRFAAYVASKNALDGFSRCFAPEVAADGIAVTTIHMPLVRTPMIAPTGMYKNFPTISSDEAADMIVEALIKRPHEVSTRVGKFGELVHAVAPNVHQLIMAGAFQMLPDSTGSSHGDGDRSEQPVTPEAYARDVDAAIKVLEGRNDEVNQDLGRRMESAAERLQFEEAAHIRDQLAKLKVIQSQQIVTAGMDHDADVIAAAEVDGEFCVALMFVRSGRSLGSTTFFPKAPLAELPEVLAAFITQYYLEREAPAEIIVERKFEEMPLLEAALAARSGHRVRISASVRGIRARWLEMVRNNAEQALTMRGLKRGSVEASLEEMREVFDLEEPPSRLECFDISHTGGTDTVASPLTEIMAGRSVCASAGVASSMAAMKGAVSGVRYFMSFTSAARRR